MRVEKWGDDLAVRLPTAVVEELNLTEGDEIAIRIEDMRSFSLSRKPGREEWLARLRSFRGRLPAGFKFERDRMSPG